jgi:sugar phosphate isomerase/epimerase
MKLSISNLAWQKIEDETIFNLMRNAGFNGLEIAPNKVFENILTINDQQIFQYFKLVKSYNLEFSSMQSLLFDRGDLKIFDESQKETIIYLKKIIDLAKKLQIKVLVFGSPKNRIINGLDKKIAYNIAIEFFTQLAHYADSQGLVFCLEVVPSQYGCDFINNTDEAVKFIKDVNAKGLGLNIDSGAIILNQENIEKAIEKSMPYAYHFHISEQNLDPILNHKTNHKNFSNILKKFNFNHWLSIEMIGDSKNSNVEVVRKTLEYIGEIYC